MDDVQATAEADVAAEPATKGEASPRNMEQNFIQWDDLNGKGKGLYEHYKRMCWFRRDHPALRSPNISIDTVYPQQKCVVYRRWTDQGDTVIVAANFDPNQQKIKIPFPAKGNWKELFTDKLVEVDGEYEIQVEKWAAAIFFRP